MEYPQEKTMKEKGHDFTEGRIVSPLMRFALPIILALFLQAMYGAVDLLVVGKFASPEDVSAVSTGSQIMMTFTSLVTSLAMGTTIFFAQQLGMGHRKEGGEIVGASIAFFTLLGLLMTFLIPLFARPIASLMQAPADAFEQTVQYIRICGAGMLAIVAYNLIGAVFRSMGDSKTPLITVAIACAVNILGDLLLIAVFHMGTAGAAIATVAAQLVSVVVSLLLISRSSLPFEFRRSMIRFHTRIIRKIVQLGFPIALQELLVGISFLVVMAVVNGLGVVASAGIGVAGKVCTFIMLVPIALSQAISAFVAQNTGAGKDDRSVKALKSSICVSLVFALGMFLLGFFRGNLLTGIFASDPDVIQAGAEYLKAYAIDCLFTCFLFCFIGYFNGIGCTTFVMVQGLIGAFCVRTPFCILMSHLEPVSLFRIGLATPASTVVQILLCFAFLFHQNRKRRTTRTSPPV